MAPLPSDLRKSLDKAVVAARDEAESACEAALRALGVPAEQAPPGISDEQRALRNALRAKQRQLGGAFEKLISECAYEQWHLMLFARFLAENDLLIHPSGAPVTLDEVAELAREEGEGDPWLRAARYASTMLPGIFKTADPCARLPLAPEGRKALEDILTELSSEVFAADDALGWVYQFWQTKRKKEVIASERKIGGADLAPVTQLFTEHYMVRFLLENSLGAWWAARHPESPLLASFDYLRFTDDGAPAAGRFEGWPATVAEVTVMDPCCGSGHFPVAAFDMLRKMREEEEGLSTRDAVDAVLRDNLFGLELDARCVQLAAFALALAAWKVAGYHELPALNLACSGIPTRGSLEEWTRLAKGDERLERALARLHELFREADTLGSLIDPRSVVEDGSLLSVPFEEVVPLLEHALANDPDPVAAVFGESAREIARAAALLAGSYALVTTNPPFLQGPKQSEELLTFCSASFAAGAGDLATAWLSRGMTLCADNGVIAMVEPSKWRYLGTYESLRRLMLEDRRIALLVDLGVRSFSTPMFDLGIDLDVIYARRPEQGARFSAIVASGSPDFVSKARDLPSLPVASLPQDAQRRNPDLRIVLSRLSDGPLMQLRADAYTGSQTGDFFRFGRCFWEIVQFGTQWAYQMTAATGSGPYTGRNNVIFWEEGRGDLAVYPGAYIRGRSAWGRSGVLLSRMGRLPATIYTGEFFDDNSGVIVPKDSSDLPALWAYCSSSNYSEAVRLVDPTIKVTNRTLVKVPFDFEHWAKVAEEQYPNGLPDPHSADPTQWLFTGKVVDSEQPLHVALARLLGYRWPDQDPDELDTLADEDGVVCLQPVAGERPAHERLRELLAAAYGAAFSQQTIDELLIPEESRTLEAWLRDRAFASHAKLFHARPFIWHLWDGRKDGFAALVNYHKLDRQTLEKLAFTYLNWWIERQRADMANGVAGAEARLAAAQELQTKLKVILEGEDPYDIYVRWKPLAEQPLGWEPDLNDGVRLNIRPFVTAGVLRAKLAIHWRKDRGKNPDGSERPNDLHFTLARKRAAREEAARSG